MGRATRVEASARWRSFWDEEGLEVKWDRRDRRDWRGLVLLFGARVAIFCFVGVSSDGEESWGSEEREALLYCSFLDGQDGLRLLVSSLAACLWSL